MNFDLPVFLQIVTVLVVIMDPVGNSAAALSLTTGLSPKQRRATINVMAVAVAILLITFFLGGRYILSALHLQTSDFLLGGGILLIIVSLGMLTGRGAMHKEEPGSVAIVPLATPLLVGPGTLTMVILIQTEQPMLEGILGVTAAALVVWAVMRVADPIHDVLGDKGVKVVSKVMAIIVVGYAGSFIHKALLEWGVATK
jgi:multiple antibiotic resistance protein